MPTPLPLPTTQIHSSIFIFLFFSFQWRTPSSFSRPKPRTHSLLTVSVPHPVYISEYSNSSVTADFDPSLFPSFPLLNAYVQTSPSLDWTSASHPFSSPIPPLPYLPTFSISHSRRCDDLPKMRLYETGFKSFSDSLPWPIELCGLSPLLSSCSPTPSLNLLFYSLTN